MNSSVSSLPHVIVVGAGFGGLRAAREMRRLPLRLTLIDRNNYHLFQPLLYQVATAGISPGEIAHPVRGILRGQKNLTFRMAEVTRIDADRKQIETSTGTLDYDYLVLAVGGQTNYFGLDSVEKFWFWLKGMEDATAIRNHILKLFELAAQEEDAETRRAMLTFVVAGGGPTGVECAGAISELIRLVLSKDYPAINLEDTRVILLEAADRLLAHMPQDLRETTAGVLARKQVDVRFGAAVANYDSQRVTLKGGEVLPARTLIWAAGVRAAEVVNSLGAPQGSQGRVLVEPTLQLTARPEVFVLGDAALLTDADGKPLPMVAPVAMQQANTVAQNIGALLQNQPLQAFQYYDPGSLATIGRNQAVAQLGRLKFRGFLAWMVWLVVHLMQLVSFRSRLLVLINWAWDYFFYERAVRLIVPEMQRKE